MLRRKRRQSDDEVAQHREENGTANEQPELNNNQNNNNNNVNNPKSNKKLRADNNWWSLFVTYKRHATAVGLLWAVFTCGFVVIDVVVFIQPQWLGRFDHALDSAGSGPGYFGLWQRCRLADAGRHLDCSGWFADFSTILNTIFKVSTLFVGLSVLVIFLCVALFIIFLIPNARHDILFKICGTLQLLSGVFLLIGCIVYPVGWDDSEVRLVCGANSDRYQRGECTVGWAYILACVGIADALILGVLALVLGACQADWPELEAPEQQTTRKRTKKRPARETHERTRSRERPPQTPPVYVVPAGR